MVICGDIVPLRCKAVNFWRNFIHQTTSRRIFHT